MPLSRVTKPAIETLVRNVTGELELLNRLSAEFDRHGLDVAPERCYSPATLAKAYYSAMGMQPPEKKFNIPEKIQAIAMQAASAGRAECMIRRVPLPVVYIDFHAQFPATSSLLDCPEILRSERDCSSQTLLLARVNCWTAQLWMIVFDQNSGNNCAGTRW
jgi:hypothetical protein